MTFEAGGEGGSHIGIRADASPAEGTAGVRTLRRESGWQVPGADFAGVCVRMCVYAGLCVRVVLARVCVCAHRGHVPADVCVNGVLFMRASVRVCVHVPVCVESLEGHCKAQALPLSELRTISDP